VVDDAIASLERPSGGEKRPLARWFTHVFSSMRAYVAGELEATQKHADAALAMRIVVGEEFALHGYCVQVSGVWRLLGHSAKTYDLVRRVSERYPALPGWRAVLAGLDAELGRRDRAERELAHLIEDDVAAIRREPYSMSALCPLAELCTFVGTPAQARKLYELLLPFEYHHGVVSFGVATHGPVARHLGMLAYRMGDDAAAERHFEAALAISEAMPSPTFIALTCLSHARALARGQGSARSKREALLRRTLAIADQTGMIAIGESCCYHLQGSASGGLVAARAR
jgi:tetratricopeptide (TPR) repeat protein